MPALRAPTTFAYYTGWRTQSKIFPLTWDRVDLVAKTVRLYRGTTKNKDGRVVLLPEILVELLTSQAHDTPTCPFVFHRNGQPIRDCYTAWRSACARAGVPGRIIHDFRRTAARNLIRAGVNERVAMDITGHKTRAVFERYNIVSESDLQEAACKMQLFAAREATRPALAGSPAPPLDCKSNGDRQWRRARVTVFFSSRPGSCRRTQERECAPFF